MLLLAVGGNFPLFFFFFFFGPEPWGRGRWIWAYIMNFGSLTIYLFIK